MRLYNEKEHIILDTDKIPAVCLIDYGKKGTAVVGILPGGGQIALAVCEDKAKAQAILDWIRDQGGCFDITDMTHD